MTELTRDQANTLLALVREAAKEIADLNGVSYTKAGGSWDRAGNLKISIEFAALNSDGQALTKEFIALQQFHPEYAGKEFYHPRHGLIRFTGLNFRAAKYPINFEIVATGAGYKAPESIFQKVTPKG